jgi:hypothetical protein
MCTLDSGESSNDVTTEEDEGRECLISTASSSSEEGLMCTLDSGESSNDVTTEEDEGREYLILTWKHSGRYILHNAWALGSGTKIRLVEDFGCLVK